MGSPLQCGCCDPETDKILAKDVAKGKMTEEEKKAALGRISTTTKLSDFSSVDFVIEV